MTYLLGVQRVKICVDLANASSAAVPRKLDLTWPEWECTLSRRSRTPARYLSGYSDDSTQRFELISPSGQWPLPLRGAQPPRTSREVLFPKARAATARR